jgi:hypothetical protein
MQKNWKLLIYFLKLALDISEETSGDKLEQDDWDDLVHLAYRQGVLPMFNEGMLKSRMIIPDTVANELKAYRLQLSMNNLKHSQELLRLISLLRKENVEVIPYKGPILAQVGLGDINRRVFSDLDILVRRQELLLISRVMEKEEYIQEIELPTWARKLYFWQYCEYNFDFYEGDRRVFHVEPHWRIGVPRFQIHANFDDISPLTQLVKFHGTYINQLSPEGLILTTMMHHSARDCWSYLKLPLDIAGILVQHKSVLNWNNLIAEAQRLNVTHLLYFSLALVENLFDYPFPYEIRRKWDKKIFKKMILNVTDQLFRETSLFNPGTLGFRRALWFHLKIRKHWTTKMKVLMHHLIRFVMPDLVNRNRTRNSEKHIRDFYSIFKKS